MRQQITLYSEDAERFQEVKENIEAQRDGYEPSNAEVVRLLMDAAGVEDVCNSG